MEEEAQTYPGMTDEFLEYLRTEVWQPKCCRDQSDHDDTSDKIGSTAARTVSTYGNVLAFLAAATIVSLI